MRLAVISDIHSNLEALTSVLEKIDSLAIDSIVCLGDIVGYNADPDGCIELFKRHKISSLMGNHDSRVCGLEEPTDFNPLAKEAILWTRRKIRRENLEYLKTLPRKLILNNDIVAVHGWINNTDMYILNQADAAVNFKLLKKEISAPGLCFFGHTHIMMAYLKMGKEIIAARDNRIKLEENRYYLINPGSVGQPRDLDPRSSFLIYDSQDRVVEFKRVNYDIDTSYNKIIMSGLPKRLAERLRWGT